MPNQTFVVSFCSFCSIFAFFEVGLLVPWPTFLVSQTGLEQSLEELRKITQNITYGKFIKMEKKTRDLLTITLTTKESRHHSDR